LNEIKNSKSSEELRKKMAVLQAQLDKSLVAKPKAKLEFGFYDSDLKPHEVRLTKYIPVDAGVVKFSFAVMNNSDVNAAQPTLWIRACKECKFHRDPPGSTREQGAPEFERIYSVPEIEPLVAVAQLDVEIEVPRWMTRMPVSLDYRCTGCEVEKDWQTLWADVGQVPIPRFSAPSSTTTAPKKP
jgi:hypothetical protein